jgi:hypothetical protein
MPLLDVSDAFDPDFMDRMTVRRRAQTVGDNGRATVKESRQAFDGIVCNDSGDTLQRGSDSARVAAGINITTPFALRIDGEGFDADVVEWDGRAYTVVAVKDYGRYGAGFCIATCSVIKPAG